jgi:hypothetical protein
MPPVRVSVVEPDNSDPAPQTLLLGRPTAVKPATTALRSSVKLMFVAVWSRSTLVSVNSSVTVPPGATGSSVNSLVSVALSTARRAVANPVELPPFTFNSELTLSYCPAPPGVTSTSTVQLAPAPSTGKLREPLAKKEIWLVPEVAVNEGGVDEVPQSVDALAGVAMTIPAGMLSVKTMFVTFEALALLSIVSVRVLLWPAEMGFGEKLLLNPGRLASTVKSAVADPLLPASDVRSPEIFACTPGKELVTLTTT